MMKTLFITAAAVPPSRWREAFPEAQVCHPGSLAAGEWDICWLHTQGGVDLQKELPTIIGRFPKARIVVMSNEPGDEEGMAALSYGARGYCNAHAAPDVLNQVVDVLSKGGMWVGESLLSRFISVITSHLRSQGGASAGNEALLQQLSERERTVAQRVAEGRCNKEIARELEISERTVKAHLSAVYEKLNARDRLQLALLLHR